MFIMSYVLIVTNQYTKLAENPAPSKIPTKSNHQTSGADYENAIREGSTSVRVGSSIFGARHYAKWSQPRRNRTDPKHVV